MSKTELQNLRIMVNAAKVDNDNYFICHMELDVKNEELHSSASENIMSYERLLYLLVEEFFFNC